MPRPGVAVILAGGGKKPSREEPSGEMDMEMGSEEESSDDPIDLFIEAVGGKPTPEARKAFKLAVKSCEDGYEEE